MNVRRIALLVVFVFLAAGSTWADEPTAEDLYHEAYVLEVIEGNVEEAARRYLRLGSDASVSADIRAASRLRFAICLTLLGRSDEARLQLEELIRDDTTPKGTRERGERMLASIAEVGTGSELDRTLQALVFDLARTEPAATSPPVYRNFEVLGKRTIPFLRTLLTHEDQSLARHAFRLLTRLGEPGLGGAWTPRIGLPGRAFASDWVQYLRERPAELRAWERVLGTLEAKQLVQLLGWLPADHTRPPFSLAYLATLVPDEVTRDLAFRLLPFAGDASARWERVESWLSGDDEALARRTADWVLDHSEGGPDDEGARRRWPRILELIAERAEVWSPTSAQRGPRSGNLLAYLRRMPSEDLLGSLERLIAMGEEPSGGDRHDPLTHGLAASVSKVLAESELDASARQRFGETLRRWLVVWRQQLDQGPDNPKIWLDSAGWLRRHIALFLEDAEEEDARAFLTFFLQGPGRDHVRDFAPMFNVQGPRDVNLLIHALSIVPAEARLLLMSRWPTITAPSHSPELKEALLEQTPRLIREAGPHGLGRSWGPVSGLTMASQAMPEEARRRLFAALFDAVEEREDMQVSHLLALLAPLSGVDARKIAADVSTFADTVIPVLQSRWQGLDAEARQEALERAWRIATNKAGRTSTGVGNVPIAELLKAENREALLAFLREHLEETPDLGWKSLLGQPALLPLEAWVPVAPATIFKGKRSSVWEELRASGEADRVARVLTKDIDAANGSVFGYVRWIASDEVARDVFDRALRSSDASTRQRAVGRLSPGCWPASPDAVEAARRAILDEAEPDLWEARALASCLIRGTPTADVFPLVRLLLQSEDANRISDGIKFARDLGQPDLLPDLIPHLDSMNAARREAARDAMQAINEVVRLKSEAMLKEKGLLPR